MGRKKSEKTPKSFSLRITDEDLYAWITEKAKREERSLNAQIVIELRYRMQQEQKLSEKFKGDSTKASTESAPVQRPTLQCRQRCTAL